MADNHYFQIKGLEYSCVSMQINKPTELAFAFTIIPDGVPESTFNVKVSFPYLFLLNLRNHASGRVFPSEMDKQRLLRYAFRQLKAQLENSSMNNHKNILLNHKDADSSTMKLPRDCNYRISIGVDLFCCADPDNPRLTFLEVCENCTLPELVLRCENLNITEVNCAFDEDQRLKMMPAGQCLKGLPISVGLKECVNNCIKYDPHKFYIN